MQEAETPRSWFEDIFGFPESNFEATRRQFEYSDNTLTSAGNGRTFAVGSFEAISVQDLHRGLAEASAQASDAYWSTGDLCFELREEDSWRKLHEEDDSAGAVFQASSLFNCLETTTGRSPEDGISIYSQETTQGSACALACPAAAVFRNYFLGSGGSGQAGDRQLNCMSEVGEVLQNSKQEWWVMRNGYCLPKVAGRIATLSGCIAGDAELEGQVRSRVRVGVHWDTEVTSGKHRVCQVFCSALPVAFVKSTRQSDWLGFAAPILEGAFDAVLAAAATLAAKRADRVRVYLTAVGMEPLGNRREWVAAAIDRALHVHEREPLDVILVHSSNDVPGSQDPFRKLEKGRRRIGETLEEDQPGLPLGASQELLLSPSAGNGAKAAGLLSWDVSPRSGGVAEQLLQLFRCFDENGDGVIDRREFTDVLRMADESYFTPQRLKLLLAEADTTQNDLINYTDFLTWVFHEDADVLSKLSQINSHAYPQSSDA